MRAPIVWELEQRINNAFVIKIKTLLERNIFLQNHLMVEWILGCIKRKIARAKRFTEFEKALTGNLKEILFLGDTFYRELFQANGFINEYTNERESITPYSDAMRQIYNSISKGDHSHPESLTIYSELRKTIEEELGKSLGNDASMQTWKKWQQTYSILEVEHSIKEAWLEAIPINNIKTEKTKFVPIRPGFKLADVARIDFVSRKNDIAAKQYLARLKKWQSKPAFEYIAETTRESDYVRFKETVSLQIRLAQKLGSNEFLLLINSLKYPVLQDHAFFYVKTLTTYTDIFKRILSGTRSKTTREHLLLIVLKNYFNFLERTLSGLDEISKRQPYDKTKEELEKVSTEAKKELNKWLTELTPQSFDEILNTLFPRGLADSGYFLLLFQWINSHSKLHLVHRVTDCKKKLIDLLNDLFQKRLNVHEKDRHYLVNSLQYNQINYEALEKLVTIHEENKNDAIFREKVYTIYVNHIASTNFSWYADGNIDFSSAINNTYYFAQILASYNDGYEKWEALFNEYKTVHEGWLYSLPDNKVYQRESFLLCAGFGMAYFKYFHKQPTEAADIFFKVLDLLIRQHRSSTDYRSIDYASPLQFAALTVGEFSPENEDRFVKIIVQKLDKLKLLLTTTWELINHSKTLHLDASTKETIKNRISKEFWIIESSKKDSMLKSEFDYYQSLKDNVLKSVADSLDVP